MGYYSERQFDLNENIIDLSYYGFERQLLSRYQDLKDYYEELFDEGAPMHGDDFFTDDDYRYAPLKYFKTLHDVYRAITLALQDLKNKCGFVPDEQLNEDEREAEPDQTTLIEIVLLPSFLQSALAA